MDPPTGSGFFLIKWYELPTRTAMLVSLVAEADTFNQSCLAMRHRNYSPVVSILIPDSHT